MAAALAFTLGTTNAIAQTELFVGAGLGTSKLSFDYKYYDSYYDESESGSESESDTLFYVRGGAVFNGDIRAYATFSKVGYDYLDQITLSASVDKLFPVNNEMSFYAGGTLGYTSFDLDDFGKESGLLAGVQGGIFYQVTPAIGVDLGVSYSITTAELEYKESFTYGRTTYTAEEKVEFESVLAFKVGVDYKF